MKSSEVKKLVENALTNRKNRRYHVGKISSTIPEIPERNSIFIFSYFIPNDSLKGNQEEREVSYWSRSSEFSMDRLSMQGDLQGTLMNGKMLVASRWHFARKRRYCLFAREDG